MNKYRIRSKVNTPIMKGFRRGSLYSKEEIESISKRRGYKVVGKNSRKIKVTSIENCNCFVLQKEEESNNDEYHIHTT